MRPSALSAAPLAAALASLLAAPVYAQTAPAPSAATPSADSADPQREPTDLDGVEVIGKVDYGYVQKSSRSATKTDTDLQDVPQAVTVVTQDLNRDQAM